MLGFLKSTPRNFLGKSSWMAESLMRRLLLSEIARHQLFAHGHISCPQQTPAGCSAGLLHSGSWPIPPSPPQIPRLPRTDPLALKWPPAASDDSGAADAR